MEDVKNYYPQVMNDVSIVLVQSADHILNTFDQKISECSDFSPQPPFVLASHHTNSQMLKTVLDVLISK